MNHIRRWQVSVEPLYADQSDGARVDSLKRELLAETPGHAILDVIVTAVCRDDWLSAPDDPTAAMVGVLISAVEVDGA